VGLVELARPKAPNLAGLVETYRATRTDVKPGTAINLANAAKALLTFFGPDRPIDQVTEADAENYYRYLLKSGKAHNTARRLTGRAKQFFAHAVKARLIPANPFGGIKTATGGNPERQCYVPAEIILKAIEYCPSAEWRLILALSRFAGLRCPSEHLALTWADVLWDQNRFVVRSPKTEHFEGKGQRIVPIFPELRPYLEEAFELAEPGSVYVISKNRHSGRKDGMMNGINVNWRTQFLRILTRAGIQPWPRLFHALRASCQTDLASRFPGHVICNWLGNSLAVAREHYLQVTDEHYELAIQGGAKSGAHAAHFPAQQGIAGICTKAQPSPQTQELQDVLQSPAALSHPVQKRSVTPSGFEPEPREPKSLVLPLHYGVKG